VALSDGRLNAVERDELVNFIDHQGFVPTISRHDIAEAFDNRVRQLEGRHSATVIVETLRPLAGLSLASVVVRTADRVAAADRKIHAGELQALKLIRLVMMTLPSKSHLGRSVHCDAHRVCAQHDTPFQRRGMDMTLQERDVFNADSPKPVFENHGRRIVASYELELARHRRMEIKLRQALAQQEALLCQKDELIQQHAVLSQESNHRLLNGLQMIVSLLLLQSRASDNPEVASKLGAAADRVATIGRIHRRLHSLDGVQTAAIKQYLEDLCRDFSMMLSSEGRSERVIVVEGNEINLPTVTAIPLSFIANELITNAAKYGTGRITVSLESNLGKGYALSVSNDGPGLPEGFDPAARNGLGMRIIQSLVGRIGGELRIGRGDKNQGTRFTVLFA
jgi:two-component sensor histidine kinase/tellurite resistance protein